MHAPELEDGTVHTSDDGDSPERAAEALGKNRSHVTDESVGASSVRRPLVAVSLEQRDLLGVMTELHQKRGAWATATDIVAATGYSKRRVTLMLASLGRAGLVATAINGAPIVVGSPAGIFYPCGRASLDLVTA